MSDLALFDTGILLRASTTTLDHADLGLWLWNQARVGALRACIAQQTVWEFFSVLTRLGTPHRDVLVEIRKHLAVFPVIAPKPTTFPDTLASLERFRWLSGPQIYDLFLAHTALDNGIATLCTFNDRHFRRFVLPLQVVNPTTMQTR